MITRDELVEALAEELSRQCKEGELGWYAEERAPSDNKIEYVAVDGNPDLYRLADAIIARLAQHDTSSR